MKSTCGLPSTSEFEANFPPQVYLENDKGLMCAEGPHHYNIFYKSALSTDV